MKNVHDLEIYAPIKDFPNYLVTSKGRVLSLHTYNGSNKIRELKPAKNRAGYLQVNLHKNGKQYSRYVHRLVAQAFIPKPENKPEVNHIDEDKTNNHVSNLEWMTHKENTNYGTHNERVAQKNSISHKGKKHTEETKQKISSSNKGKKHTEETKQKISSSNKGKKRTEEMKQKMSGTNRPNIKKIIGFKIDGCDIKYYKYIKECERDGFTPSNVIGCCRKYKGYKAHKGYVWYYADEYFDKNRGENNE